MTIPTLETDRLTLGPWDEAATRAYAAISAKPDVRRFMYPPRPLNESEAHAEVHDMRAHWEREGFGHWAVTERESGRLIGRTGIKHHPDWPLDPDGNAECGWLYDSSAWGRGYATEAGRAVVEFGFRTLCRPELISITDPENAASRAVMERLGFAYVGRRVWEARDIDIVWYSQGRV